MRITYKGPKELENSILQLTKGIKDRVTLQEDIELSIGYQQFQHLPKSFDPYLILSNANPLDHSREHKETEEKTPRERFEYCLDAHLKEHETAKLWQVKNEAEEVGRVLDLEKSNELLECITGAHTIEIVNTYLQREFELHDVYDTEVIGCHRTGPLELEQAIQEGNLVAMRKTAGLPIFRGIPTAPHSITLAPYSVLLHLYRPRDKTLILNYKLECSPAEAENTLRQGIIHAAVHNELTNGTKALRDNQEEIRKVYLALGKMLERTESGLIYTGEFEELERAYSITQHRLSTLNIPKLEEVIAGLIGLQMYCIATSSDEVADIQRLRRQMENLTYRKKLTKTNTLDLAKEAIEEANINGKDAIEIMLKKLNQK